MAEIRTNKYREKKGLPPLKRKWRRKRNVRSGSVRNIKEKNAIVGDYLILPIETVFKSSASPFGFGVILWLCSPTTPGGLINITSAHTLW